MDCLSLFLSSLWILYLILHNFRRLPHRPLGLLAMGICLVQLTLIACDGKWWGVCCYGPRLMSDVLPWLALLAILGCAAELYSLRTSFARTNTGIPTGCAPESRIMGAVTIAISILI